MRLDKRQRLQSLLDHLKSHVPTEFQRNTFDLKNLAKWKATMHRFLINYAGIVIMSSVLSRDKYRHYLLLAIACRILNDKNLAVQYANYAQSLLTLFFQLLPRMYGQKAQKYSVCII